MPESPTANDRLKAIKIVRLSPSFASQEVPGSGLNAYFHATLSAAQNLVITEFKNHSYLSVPSNVEIFPVQVRSGGLGSLEISGIRKIKNFSLKLISTLVVLFKSIEKLAEFQPDIVHLYSPIHFVTAMYCKFKFGSKVVVSFHGTDVHRLKKSFVLRYLMRMTDHMLLLSNKTVEDLNLRPNDCTFIGNGFDDSLFFLDGKIERKKIVLSVGSLRWQKDHATLLQAFVLFKERSPEYTLVIVGEGELENELKSLSRELKIENAVTFIPKMFPSDVGNLMRESSFFVLSSISEGSPKVVLEALSCGLPVIATNVGDLVKVLGSRVICSTQSPKELAELMLVTKNELDNIDRDNLVKSVSPRTWAKIVRSLDNIYLTLNDSD